MAPGNVKKYNRIRKPRDKRSVRGGIPGVYLMRYLLAFLLLPASLMAQEKKDRKPGDEMIEKYLAAETDKLSSKFPHGAKTLDEWKAKRPRLYQEYMDMLGLW